MGVDMATHDELIANQLDVEGIRRRVGADSLAYLSLDGLLEAVESGPSGCRGHCTACFSGQYPIEILQNAGVDLTNPDSILSALDVFDRSVDELSRLLQKN